MEHFLQGNVSWRQLLSSTYLLNMKTSVYILTEICLQWSNRLGLQYLKCGQDQHIDKLVEVIKAAAIPNDELTKELEEFGCTIPNCETTEWLEEAYQTFDYGISSTFSSKITVQFSSSRKVGIFYTKKTFFWTNNFKIWYFLNHGW